MNFRAPASSVSRTLAPFLVAAGVFSVVLPVQAAKSDDAQAGKIRQALTERIPQLSDIEEISATPMKGLYEVRMGTDVFYTDATGDFLIQGELFDTKAKHNLTEERINQLTQIQFASLPFDDAFKMVRGDGSRQIAVFEDPNCGYCKRFERDMRNLDNVTVHIFLYPILSPDSFEKSRDIWCAAEPEKAWNDWMLDDKKPATRECKTIDALQRNLAFGKQYKITGTPTIIFEDGARVPGAVPHQQIEKKLASLSAKTDR